MTRRTREAMASELQLPEHYVELDSQEMMYVDGGSWFYSEKRYEGYMGWLRIGHYLGMGAAAVASMVAGISLACLPTGVSQVVGAMAFIEGFVGCVFNFVAIFGAVTGMIAKGYFTEISLFGIITLAA